MYLGSHTSALWTHWPHKSWSCALKQWCVGCILVVFVSTVRCLNFLHLQDIIYPAWLANGRHPPCHHPPDTIHMYHQPTSLLRGAERAWIERYCSLEISEIGLSIVIPAINLEINLCIDLWDQHKIDSEIDRKVNLLEINLCERGTTQRLLSRINTEIGLWDSYLVATSNPTCTVRLDGL